MDITKITQSTINLAQNVLNRGTKICAEAPATLECSEKLTEALDCLAINAVSGIKSAKTDIPEFIYHITSKENFEKILQDKKITLSAFETGQNGCGGIYLVDKDNFLQKWLGRQEPDLFGALDLGEALMMWTCKASSPVAIKVPTSSLNLSKLRFRPYIDVCVESAEKLDPNTMKINSKLVTQGLPLSDLQKYAKADEPIEFVYTDEIPVNIFKDWSVAKFSENMRDMIQELFG